MPPVRALAAYKDFLTLWKDADPDIPILKQAKAEYARLQQRFTGHGTSTSFPANRGCVDSPSAEGIGPGEVIQSAGNAPSNQAKACASSCKAKCRDGRRDSSFSTPNGFVLFAATRRVVLRLFLEFKNRCGIGFFVLENNVNRVSTGYYRHVRNADNFLLSFVR